MLESDLERLNFLLQTVLAKVFRPLEICARIFVIYFIMCFSETHMNEEIMLSQFPRGYVRHSVRDE